MTTGVMTRSSCRLRMNSLMLRVCTLITWTWSLNVPIKPLKRPRNKLPKLRWLMILLGRKYWGGPLARVCPIIKRFTSRALRNFFVFSSTSVWIKGRKLAKRWSRKRRCVFTRRQVLWQSICILGRARWVATMWNWASKPNRCCFKLIKWLKQEP